MGTNRPTRMWELARAVVQTRPCPDCGQPAGEWCMTLRDRSPRKIAEPHMARYPAGNRVQRDPANAALLNGRKELG